MNQRANLQRKNGTLYCFYDLSVSYANYDFFQFLQLAELHRKRHGKDKLFLIFIAGSDSKSQYSQQDTAALDGQIMSNFLIPACWLLPSCVDVAWLKDEEEIKVLFGQAGDAVFPTNYNPHMATVQPTTKYISPEVTAAYLRGEEFSLFEEPDEYAKMVASYLASQEETSKIITLTVRGTDLDPAVRTQIYREWESFLGTLPKNEYRIIIIPDDYRNWQQSSFFCRYEHCETATINVLFRVALYRHAYLNMFIDNSCADSVRWTSASALVFNQINRQVTSSLPWFRSILGVDFGDQLPMTQNNHVLVWGTQTKELIKGEFDKFTSEYSKRFPDQTNGLAKHGIQSTRQKHLLCESVLNDISEKMSVWVEQEHIDTIKAIIRLDPDYAMPRYLLGLVAAQIDDFDNALQLFDDCIILSNNERNPNFDKECYNLKAGIFEKLDKPEQALQEYLELNKKYPEDTNIAGRISVLKRNYP